MLYVEVALVVILGFLFEHFSIAGIRYEKRRRCYIYVCICMFWIIAAFRNVEWAASLHLDAGGYSWIFETSREKSITDIIHQFYLRYIARLDEWDTGYILLNKLIGIFTDNYNVFSLIADSLFFIPFGMLIVKYTSRIEQVIVAFLFYIALIQLIMISGGRQMLAIGLDILVLMFVMEHKIKKAFILFIAGVSIHFSSLLFFFPLFLIFFNVKARHIRKLHLLSFAAFPLVFLFPNKIISFLGSVSGVERYRAFGTGNIAGGGYTFILLMGMLSIFCFIAFSVPYLRYEATTRYFYTMVPFFTFTAPLVNSNGSMMRICLYYYLYLVVLIPYGIDRLMKPNSKKIIYGITICALVMLILRAGVLDYHFMWDSF